MPIAVFLVLTTERMISMLRHSRVINNSCMSECAICWSTLATLAAVRWVAMVACANRAFGQASQETEELYVGFNRSFEAGNYHRAEQPALEMRHLAILSGCDTNAGPLQRGEGIWGLSRDFLVAGARRVVASNWLVDDEAAPNFVGYFSSIIAKSEKEGKTPDYAQAVHDAKLFLRRHQNKKWHNPHYWGMFVLIGPN
jgi:CHAT domain-containing protein